MARGRRTGTAAGIFTRGKPRGSSVACDTLLEIGRLIRPGRGWFSTRAHQKMMGRIACAVQAVENERTERWGAAGASERFMEHVLDRLPATRAQLEVLGDLIDPGARIGLTAERRWEHSAALTHGQVRGWTAALVHEYALTREPTDDDAIGAVRDEVCTSLRPTYREGVGPNPLADAVTESALYLSRYRDGCSFGTSDQLLRALDQDRAEWAGERDSDGADARAAVLAVGELIAERLAEGTMADLTCAQLGLDPATATSTHRAHQHEVIREMVTEAPLYDRDFARAYLAQAGLSARDLGPLADLVRPDADLTRLVTLAQGIRTVLWANHKTSLATPAHTAQLAAWLMSTPPNSDEPVHWFFERNHMRSVALRLSGEARLHLHAPAPAPAPGAGASAPGAGATAAGAPGPAASTPPAQVRSIRDAMTRR